MVGEFHIVSQALKPRLVYRTKLMLSKYNIKCNMELPNYSYVGTLTLYLQLHAQADVDFQLTSVTIPQYFVLVLESSHISLYS